MRKLVFLSVLLALGSCKEELYFIPGTGVLPQCNEAPVTDLNGTLWFDQGTVTIRSSGAPFWRHWIQAFLMRPVSKAI